MTESRRTQNAQTGGESRKTFGPGSYSYPFSTDIAELGRLTEQHIHGGILELATAQPLNSSPTDIVVTVGIGKMMVVVNTGSDIAGTITITGTSVDRDTGVETAGDTDTVTVHALSIDASDTDSNGNPRHSLTGAYITSKWFTGTVTLSTTDLTLTDVDVSQISFEQANDAPKFVLTTFDLNIGAVSTLGVLDTYLYSVVVVGNKVDITRESSLNIINPLADRLYRKRLGDVGIALDGITSGFFVEMFNGSPNRFVDLTLKVWVSIIGSGTDVLTIATKGAAGPALSTDNAVVRWDGATGKLLQDSGVIIDDSDNVSGVGNLSLTGTVDGRDVDADGTKLDTIETNADVTDGVNVAAAGALMQSVADAKGDMLAAVSAAGFIRVVVGANGFTLTPDSGEAAGVKWIKSTVWSGKQIATIVTAQPPDNSGTDVAVASNYPGGSTPALVHRGFAFSGTASQYMRYKAWMLYDYDNSSSIRVEIPWLALTHAANPNDGIRLDVTIAPFVYGTTDLDGDIFSSSTTVSVTDLSVTQGVAELAMVTITRAQAGSISAGNGVALMIFRDHDHAGDTLSGSKALILPDVRLVYA